MTDSYPLIRHTSAKPASSAALRTALGLALSLLLALLVPRPLFAVSCTLQGEMTPQTRSSMEQAARTLLQQVAAGSAAQVRASTIPTVAAQFQSIANNIQRLAPLISGATITIDAMYSLDASDLKQQQSEVQFFCDSQNASLHEEVGIPGLPPGAYGLVVAHATGVKAPQQFGLLLQSAGPTQWNLAGFFSKPLEDAGHGSLWYWTKARQYAQKGQAWNAHFYYRIAADLALPVGFISTPNLQKLLQEQSEVKAQGLPGTAPAVLTHNGQSYTITGLRTDSSLGGLDLVVEYSVPDVSDPVAARTRILGLMSAMLAEYPQLREAFHGLWVFANAPGQQPFAIEQPMDQIH
jgi:hypothetical protein